MFRDAGEALEHLLGRLTRTNAFALVLVVFYLTFPLLMFFHEGGHYLMARTLGVPSSQIDLGWIFYVVPYRVSIHDFDLTVTQQYLFSFSGGFTAGVVSALLTVMWWTIYRRVRAERYWWNGTFALAFAVTQLFECYQETLNHAEYISFKYTDFALWIIAGLPAILNLFKYRKRIGGFLRNNLSKF